MRETIRGQTHKRQRKSRSAVRRFIRPWHSCLGNFRLARLDWGWVELNRIKVELFRIEVELFGTSNFLNEVEFFCSNRTFFTLVRRTADKTLRYFFFYFSTQKKKTGRRAGRWLSIENALVACWPPFDVCIYVGYFLTWFKLIYFGSYGLYVLKYFYLIEDQCAPGWFTV